MIDLPKFKIGNLEINLIQGGMGVGISLRNLASAVANSGGAGTIASVGIGLLKGYPGSYIRANQDAFRDEIRATRRMSNGVIGVNIMYALTDYEDLIKVAIEENVDFIISGAGIAKNLPKFVGDKNICLVPIVSDIRSANIITYAWSRYNKVPDAFIVEGPDAGGHLGFNYEALVTGTVPSLEKIAKEVIGFVNDRKNFRNPVPVIVGGGIYTGGDIRKAYEKWEATGVQIATRFVTTRECDADYGFKQAYLNAKKEDIQIIKSPLGLPGRAIINPFLERVRKGEKRNINCRYSCLKTCDPSKSPYCIANALISAQKGGLDNGFAFAGTNAYRAKLESGLDAEET